MVLSVAFCSFKLTAVPLATAGHVRSHLLQLPASKKLTATSRSSFPKDFLFGTSSSAAQYEGASDVDGRTESIWDNWCKLPGKIEDGSNCSTTMEQYYLYEDDVKLMKEFGLTAYRFSISWTRLFPDDRVNPAGLSYYNNLIDKLLENGITPFVTIYHWDLPQRLQNEIDGWIDRRIIDKYAKFAEICFAAFGNRVKHWITINEPHQSLMSCYALGTWPPGKTSETEVYTAGHITLLAHAEVVKIYREKYKPKQGGQIGIALDCEWAEPLYNDPCNVPAAYRALDFEIGWFLSPIVYGDYPETMRKNVGIRLPRFTPAEVKDLKGSIDFLGVNYYTSSYVQDDPTPGIGYEKDMHAKRVDKSDGIPIGPEAYDGSWLKIVPWGFYKLLNYIKNNYGNPPIFVTENGSNNAPAATTKDLLCDPLRVQYLLAHYTNMEQAMRDGTNIKGHFIWSLLDCWEWASGYTNSFGLVHVDRCTEKRTPKLSALWLQSWLAGRNIIN